MRHSTHAQTPFGDAKPLSTNNSIASRDEVEFGRWVVATVIAVLIAILVTALAFLIDGMLRQKVSDQYQTAVPPPDPAMHLLSSVSCNSTLCRRYSELISSCAGHSGGSPCDGLSRFVCGEGVCYERPFECLIRGYLRALAADALASWRSMPRTSQWPAVDRAADLYLECRQVADGSDGDSPTNILEGVTAAQLRSLLITNETAGELATRLASRYQDGALFWLDAAGRRLGESKGRLLVKPNKPFLQFAEFRDSSAGDRRRRRSASSTRGANYSSRAIDDTTTVYNPQLVAVAKLDRYGLSSEVLTRELNRDAAAAFASNEIIEVTNSVILTFLRKVFSLKNVKPYLAWKFLRHRRACFASFRFQERTLADSCFDCVERVAGLAAHSPFLRISSDVDSQAKGSVFLTHLKNFVVTAVSGAKWLSPMQQELTIERLFKFEFTRGVPARKTGVAAQPPAFPNVLTAGGSAYIPAVALVPPLYSYGESEHVNFGFLGVALIRSLVHNLGFTGLQELPRSKKRNTAVGYLDLLGRCLRLNRSSRQAYASEVADAFAVGAVVRAFFEGRLEKRESEEHSVFIDICALTCTHENPHRCNPPAEQKDQFDAAFACPHTSAMTKATKCTLW
ncbi:hypothetical protein MTO96_041103 [Rhipicephalus appendiculatus]